MIAFKHYLLLTSLFCVPVYLYSGDPDNKLLADLSGKLSPEERQICIGIAQKDINDINTEIAECDADLATINKKLTAADTFLNSQEQILQKMVDNEEAHWQTQANEMTRIYASCYRPLKDKEIALKNKRSLLVEDLQNMEKKLDIVTNSNQQTT